MSPYILGFQEIDKSMLAMVGGKGANLGELARIEGISVPDGFCITTEAFKRIILESPAVNELLDPFLSTFPICNKKYPCQREEIWEYPHSSFSPDEGLLFDFDFSLMAILDKVRNT